MTTVSDIDQQIAALEAQKAELLAKEKQTALDKVNAAIAELNALGFSYKLVGNGDGGGGGGPTRRRTGIRDTVLKLIKDNPGISRQDLLDKAGVVGDKSGENSVSNALSNLKKAGHITGDKGIYEPA